MDSWTLSLGTGVPIRVSRGAVQCSTGSTATAVCHSIQADLKCS